MCIKPLEYYPGPTCLTNHAAFQVIYDKTKKPTNSCYIIQTAFIIIIYLYKQKPMPQLPSLQTGVFEET